MSSNNKRPVRRGALLSPWGVGAIVPFPKNETLIIAGLDEWDYHNHEDDFEIKEGRLKKRLGVTKFLLPPDFRENNADRETNHLSVHAYRFPRWYYCPFCGEMKKLSLTTLDIPRCDSDKCKNNGKKLTPLLIPERFIVVCPEGHVDDFPLMEWVHFNSEHKYNPETCRITRSTGGSSGSLAAVSYKCSCGAQKSLASAYNPKVLEKVYHCSGARVWHGETSGECNAKHGSVVATQRGATNIWFPYIVSSIFLGESASDKIRDLVEDLRSVGHKCIVNDEIDKAVFRHIFEICKPKEICYFDNVYDILSNELKGIGSEEQMTTDIDEYSYRLDEYIKLKISTGTPEEQFYCKNVDIKEYDSSIQKYFYSISRVFKLKETRALAGFSRLEYPENPDINEMKKTLWKGSVGKWLPAIEVFGEGLFFEFNEKTLAKWRENNDVINRIEKMNKAYHSSWRGASDKKDLRPEYVMIHTFAHLLINQLSFECGYGSSSIKERIYCEKTSNREDMYGLLIYTASGDADGSLGGLVEQGIPGRIENLIKATIKNAEWCSSDPVCIESGGQGPESCNLAACHNCALLPETCCETGNRYLDRGVIVGLLDNKEIGFFSELNKDGEKT